MEKIKQPGNLEQPYNWLQQCLSPEYLRIIDDGSFLIYYKARDLKNSTDHGITFPRSATGSHKIREQHWLLKILFF